MSAAESSMATPTLIGRAGAAAARHAARRAAGLKWFQIRIWELLTARQVPLSREADPRADFLRFVAARAETSRAQLFQDLWILWARGLSGPGYFVEFGATNGVDLSNSLGLERDHAWTGLLAEPFSFWHDALQQNRTAIKDHRCVWHTSGQWLAFAATTSMPEYAGLSACAFEDALGDARREAAHTTVEVETVTLHDLLAQHQAPERIDYLSVDTEGSELEILRAFDFSRYQVDRITVEHNFHTARRAGLYELLTKRGYRRCFSELSRWDDWYEHHDAKRVSHSWT